MTLEKILGEVREFRPISVPHLRRCLKRIGIEPLGARQSPQHYPEDASKRLLVHLGFGSEVQPAGQNGFAAHGPDDGKIPTLAKLKHARRKAGRGK